MTSNFLIGNLHGFFSVKRKRLRLGSTGIGSRPILIVSGNSHSARVKRPKMSPSVSGLGGGVFA
jgi:hypothetical protein